MGILSHHVPSIVQLRPGVIEVISEGNAAEKYFGHTLYEWSLMVVSGGFATIQPGNLLSINAVEAYSLEDFSAEAVRSGLADAQRVAGGSGSEEEVAEARIEVEVYEALQVIPFISLLMNRLPE
jgi:F-type H+-transporting ATPase subunit delta